MGNDIVNSEFCRNIVRNFSIEMENRLRQNDDYKGDTYVNFDDSFLIRKILHNVSNVLDNKFVGKGKKEYIQQSLVDIANYCMFMYINIETNSKVLKQWQPPMDFDPRCKPINVNAKIVSVEPGPLKVVQLEEDK